MIFPVISKFNAKLVKMLKLQCKRQCQIRILSTPWQVTPRQTHLTVYVCPGYQRH